jgi:hypothetical protein
MGSPALAVNRLSRFSVRCSARSITMGCFAVDSCAGFYDALSEPDTSWRCSRSIVVGSALQMLAETGFELDMLQGHMAQASISKLQRITALRAQRPNENRHHSRLARCRPLGCCHSCSACRCGRCCCCTVSMSVTLTYFCWPLAARPAADTSE